MIFFSPLNHHKRRVNPKHALDRPVSADHNADVNVPATQRLQGLRLYLQPLYKANPRSSSSRSVKISKNI